MKVTLLKPMFVIFLPNDAFSITLPNKHIIDLQFVVKDFRPKTHYVSWHNFIVTHIWSKQAMHLKLLFIFNSIHNIHIDCHFCLLDKTYIVIICIVNSILSMTVRQNWLNVWLTTLDGYFEMQFRDRGQHWFTWDDREDKFHGNFYSFAPLQFELRMS